MIRKGDRAGHPGHEEQRKDGKEGGSTVGSQHVTPEIDEKRRPAPSLNLSSLSSLPSVHPVPASSEEEAGTDFLGYAEISRGWSCR